MQDPFESEALEGTMAVQKHTNNSPAELKETLTLIGTLSESERFAYHFMQSGMFKEVKDVHQALVKIQAGKELGIGAFASMRGLNMISGKLEMAANLMAAVIDNHPLYDYVVEKHDHDACIIAFYKQGKFRGRSEFTREDAIKAGTKNIEKFDRNMFYARAMSNGAKWYAPGAFAGAAVYSLGEISGDNSEYEIPGVQQQQAAPQPNMVIEPIAAPDTKAEKDELYKKIMDLTPEKLFGADYVKKVKDWADKADLQSLKNNLPNIEAAYKAQKEKYDKHLAQQQAQQQAQKAHASRTVEPEIQDAEVVDAEEVEAL